MNEIITAFKKGVYENFVNFGGRTRRSDFWLFTLGLQILQLIVILPVFGLLIYFFFSFIDRTSTASGGLFFVLFLIFFLVVSVAMLVLLIPALAITVRRLHDTNRSGWWMLLSIVPFGSLIVFYFLISDSNEGVNEYGEDPKHEERMYYRNLVHQSIPTGADEASGYTTNY